MCASGAQPQGPRSLGGQGCPWPLCLASRWGSASVGAGGGWETPVVPGSRPAGPAGLALGCAWCAPGRAEQVCLRSPFQCVF